MNKMREAANRNNYPVYVNCDAIFYRYSMEIAPIKLLKMLWYSVVFKVQRKLAPACPSIHFELLPIDILNFYRCWKRKM